MFCCRAPICRELHSSSYSRTIPDREALSALYFVTGSGLCSHKF
uniref:Uncharacterized protein n=1 Tax=Timema genevievae TaxID=629358 RepID=A0A7R9K5Z6_TIMGE|nr:unnamed protein product [Timema genevievae]